MLKHIVSDPREDDLSDHNAIQAYLQVPATEHVADTAPLPTIVPARRAPRLPFAPWRFMLLAAVLIAAIPCGIAAAAPAWNGADLAVLLLLVAFVSILLAPGEDMQ